ncbi:MAG: prepilin peptidase [Lachnospiraceae bacterium]|nr:prepilin peptidase [Lachnospiraceae bacterium]
MTDAEIILWSILFYVMLTCYGLLVGSFLNVVIFRVPKEESIAKKRSHCMSCGYQLAWFDLVPVFSWLALKGKCRKCGAKISKQYPIIEALNAVMVVITFMVLQSRNAYKIFEDFRLETLLIAMMGSALIALSVIDFRTYIIPPGINYFILSLGLINVIYRLLRYYFLADKNFRTFSNVNISLYVIGFFAVSVPLLLIYIISGGRAIGGGDIKLMAAAGLLIGWKKIVLALFIGCLVGSIIHIARMKISKAEHVLAMGPYLSVGIMVAALWGEPLINWYLGFFKK